MKGNPDKPNHKEEGIMKKALAFVMSLTLMAAMLTGCGSAASSSEAPAPAESSVAEESKEEAAERSAEAGAAVL